MAAKTAEAVIQKALHLMGTTPQTLREVAANTGISIFTISKLWHKHEVNRPPRECVYEGPIQFAQIPEKTCETCGRRIVFWPCVACAAKAKLLDEQRRAGQPPASGPAIC